MTSDLQPKHLTCFFWFGIYGFLEQERAKSN